MINSRGVAHASDGPAAFEVMRRRLAGDAVIGLTVFTEPALLRLADVLDELEERGSAPPSPLDLAILVRQVLRYEELRYQATTPVSVKVLTGTQWPSADDWNSVGVDARRIDRSYSVRALAWRPVWLRDVGEIGVDATAAAEVRRRQESSVPGDPFLARFNRSHYRSLGQRSAVRAALTTPPGATLLICLPTGDGKSFIFQLVGKLGFSDAEPGVTLVITPTVALALDHERAAHDLGFPNAPLAYRSGNENRQIIDGIRNGTQQLCFASPEAACGRLQPALMQAARSGLLRTIVVDEAHLVETWGVNFRSEFQLLAGVRRSLLSVAGGPAPRTLLLSATMTEETIATLKALFASDNADPPAFAVYAAARLRPEIEYWVAPLSDEAERERRVLEALLHLPRPAILYVTQRRHADQWFMRLRQRGFRRIALLTGETQNDTRQKIVEKWCRGKLDVVVGTSAFGLGIDNPHVRTVVHACVPESLDRLYQEVGRGGRDGTACISLVIPTYEDVKTARSLNRPKLITVNVGFERWKAMFDHPEYRYDMGSNTHTVRLDTPPGMDAQRIDMVSEQSTEWNSRTLILMASAGMIRLLGAEESSSLSQRESGIEPEPTALRVYPTQRLQVLDPRHLNPAIWDEIIEPRRTALATSAKANLRRMVGHLHASTCVAKLIAPLYDVNSLTAENKSQITISVALACGGCPHCRRAGRPPYSEPIVETPFPWSGRMVVSGTGTRLLDEWNRVIVFYPTALEEWRANKRRQFLDGLARLIKSSKIQNVIAPQRTGLDFVALQERVSAYPLFTSDRLIMHGLPPGPAIIVLPPEERILQSLLAPRQLTDARFLFVQEEAEDPNAPGIPLRRRHRGRQLTLAQFLWEVEQ
jgi:ATP-dependent DNA helicase RecQ